MAIADIVEAISAFAGKNAFTAWHSAKDRLDERHRPPRASGDVLRRGGRVVEGARLERVYTGNRIEGSNPSLSAISACHAVAFIGFSQIPWGTNPQFTPHFSWILVDYIVALARHRP